MQDDTVITGPLYESKKKVYPQATHGTFRNIKWGLMAFTLGVYYLMPFLRWDRGPNLPDQAVLIDMPARRFYFFFIEIWPQEVYYFTGLLIIAAITLFLMNAVAGRVWCGYLCSQTVWTDLFYAVERWVEGDRRERIMQGQGRLDGPPCPRGRHQALPLAADRAGHRRRLGALFRQRADAAAGAGHLAGPGRRLYLDRHPDLHHLYPRRPHARAGLHLHVSRGRASRRR